MNDRSENRLSRNLKVITFMDKHEAELVVGAPVLATFVAQYRTKIAECVQQAQNASGDITGASEQKTYLRKTMSNLGVSISGALYAYFLSVNNAKDAKKNYLPKSTMDLARDTDAYMECKKIFESAQANSAAIVPFSVTALKITELGNAIDAFFAIIEDPQDERIDKTTALVDFEIAMRESDAILVIIAGIMLAQKEAFPALHLRFLGAIAIDNNRGGGTSAAPNFEFTIAPGTFYTATTIAYKATQQFKAVNLSAQSINWGISNAEGSFTHPPIILPAAASRTQMSASLGASGDFLVFQNTSPEAVSIELWVLGE